MSHPKDQGSLDETEGHKRLSLKPGFRTRHPAWGATVGKTLHPGVRGVGFGSAGTAAPQGPWGVPPHGVPFGSLGKKEGFSEVLGKSEREKEAGAFETQRPPVENPGWPRRSELC